MATVEEQNQAPESSTGIGEQNKAPASSTGMDPKLGALLSYLLGIIGGVIFLLIEKDNKYVRFHAAQSIVFGATVFIIGIAWGIFAGIVTAIPGIGFVGAILFLVLPLFWLGVFVIAIMLIIRAWTDYDKGVTFKLPVIGGIAEKIAGQ
ncbi:hypothetical protein LCGC14_2445630 [marine sediment metagenome]|uniref:DUF4870 domain-containing protein n=1 Tax=marine sediment metagenome TaxID=412755 RepID=A0A0F9BHW3_9ZZZZ